MAFGCGCSPLAHGSRAYRHFVSLHSACTSSIAAVKHCWASPRQECAMTHVQSIVHCGHNENHTSPWKGRCVYGFQLQTVSTQQPIALTTSGQRGRSLLSERLLNKELVEYDCMQTDASQDGYTEEESDEAGCTFPEDECWDWLDAQDSSMQESDRSSHTSSQPIAIPASCYFKDEVQRQALDKLNQKRKWYQQQLEAERMMARSMAKSRQAAAAARGNKPSGRPGAPT